MSKTLVERLRASVPTDEYVHAKVDAILTEAADEIDRLTAELTRCADMLSAIAGDIEDGHSLTDLRGKYVTAILNARDDARKLLRSDFGRSRSETPAKFPQWWEEKV